MEIQKSLLTLAETASLIGTSVDTVRRRIRSGDLDAVARGTKSVRVPAAAVAKYAVNYHPKGTK